MKSFITILGIAILFAAASGKNLKLDLETSAEEFESKQLESKPQFLKHYFRTSQLVNLESGDLFEFQETKYLCLMELESKFVILDLETQVKYHEPNLLGVRIGNVKALL